VAEIRVRGHLAHERHERFRSEDAVRVEHDHEVIAAAPARHEIVQIADLAADVVGAAPIPNAHSIAELLAQHVIGRGLLDVELGPRRVGKHENLEGRRVLLEQGFGHREQPGERARRALVVDRHHQRSALLDAQIRFGAAPYPAEQYARHGGGSRQRDPTERDREQRDHRPLQHRHDADGHDGDHLERRVDRQRQRAAKRH
jgi:hypothetical protein